MSEQRLIDANFLALCLRMAAERLASENGDDIVSDTFATLAEYLESARIGVTVDAVPREEHESLLRRFQQLEAERDALMHYLHGMGCDTCLYDDYDGSEPPCINCTATRDMWVFEGVQKEVRK